MLFLVLLPFIPAVWWIATRSVEDALIDVFLPVMVVIPTFYILHVPHLMGFDAHDAALLPIVVVAFAKYGKQWRFQRTDLWIAIFILGAGYADARASSTQGLRTFFQIAFAIFLPYAAGKLLLEQEGMRVRFLRRFGWLLAFVAIVSLVEFRLSRNLFTIILGKIFDQEPLNVELIRGGFTRTQGPFSHSIVAGIVYGAAWIFALWLSYSDKLTFGPSEPRLFGIRRSRVLVGLLFHGSSYRIFARSLDWGHAQLCNLADSTVQECPPHHDHHDFDRRHPRGIHVRLPRRLYFRKSARS